MTPEERALRDMWVAEMWRTCPEVPREHRAEQRKQDRATQRELEELTVLNSLPTVVPINSTAPSTGCARNGPEKVA